jgi:ribose transport system permease protein
MNRAWIRTSALIFLLAGLCLVSATQSPTFFTWNNLVHSLLTNVSAPGIIACGMTLVMIAGGFDLSVAAITAVCSVVCVLVLEGAAARGPGVAIPLAAGATALSGLALGFGNGLVVSRAKVNPFVVTLSTMLIFRGLALILTRGGQSISVPLTLRESFHGLYWGKLAGLPIPLLLFGLTMAASAAALRYTRFGAYLYAVGSNENASWLAGVNTAGIKAASYALCGLGCGLAAMVYVSMSSTAQAASYQGLEMTVIAAVIVGGTPLGGGSGGVGRTLTGLLVLHVIQNLMTQFRVPAEYQPVVTGAIILAMVTIDVWVRRIRRF